MGVGRKMLLLISLIFETISAGSCEGGGVLLSEQASVVKDQGRITKIALTSCLARSMKSQVKESHVTLKVLKLLLEL